jgi:hypothetical protein
MKVPLESIPTEQIVLVDKNPSRAEVRKHRRESDHVKEAPEVTKQGGQLDKAYPWLFGASTCLSALLCWMYVTKPVVTQNSEPASRGAMAQPVVGVEDTRPTIAKAAGDQSSQPKTAVGLIPSDTSLPGEIASNVPVTVSPASPQIISPGKLAASHRGKADSDVGLGWESTNLKIQHILSADAGNGDLEKIVINVPVIYETRTMRWTTADIAKARNVMARLMVYERNLTNIRREGQGIMKDWNDLLEGSVPAPALRADSPSLPYNHGQGGQSGGLPGSSSVIKVEH